MAGRAVRRRRRPTPAQGRILVVAGVVLLLAAYLVALQGCRDETAYIEGNVVEVTVDEFRIDPRAISVKQGPVSFIVTNKGEQVHNLHIETIVPRASEKRKRKVLEIKGMRPGEVQRGIQTLSPGRYRWRSTLANDDDLGMWGTIEVR